jgi:hypothetical protein
VATAVAVGQALVATPTTNEAAVTNATTMINNAIAALVVKPATPVDTTPLTDAAARQAAQQTLATVIAGYAGLQASAYTPASWAGYAAALAAAQAQVKAADATPASIQASLTALAKAAMALQAPQTPSASKSLKSHKPAVKGSVKRGKTVKVNKYTSKWTKGVKLSTKWYVNGKKVKSGATKLKLKGSWKGKKLVVKVTGKKAGYKTVTVKSKTYKIK